MMTDKKVDTVKADFMKVIREVNKGQSPFELSQALEKLIAAVRDTKKPGKLVYTLSVTPVAQGDNQASVSDDIDLKLPKKSRFTSLFFTTKDNQLSRKDPNQIDMDL